MCASCPMVAGTSALIVAMVLPIVGFPDAQHNGNAMRARCQRDASAMPARCQILCAAPGSAVGHVRAVHPLPGATHLAARPMLARVQFIPMLAHHARPILPGACHIPVRALTEFLAFRLSDPAVYRLRRQRRIDGWDGRLSSGEGIFGRRAII